MTEKHHVYSVQFNEGQRQILQTALQALQTNARCILSTEPGSGCIAGESEYGEYTILLEMIQELPQIELENPGILHGLCL